MQYGYKDNLPIMNNNNFQCTTVYEDNLLTKDHFQCSTVYKDNLPTNNQCSAVQERNLPISGHSPSLYLFTGVSSEREKCEGKASLYSSSDTKITEPQGKTPQF